MVKPEIVTYLQGNLKKYPIDALRQQLAEEGISAEDFDDSLKAAMRAPAPGETRATPSRASLAFLLVGVFVVAGLAVLFIKREPKTPATSSTVVSASGESAFVGHTGYVIRLPKNYAAVASFKDQQKTVEVVYFCRNNTDPTNFLNEGLFGQLGIVRLEVLPNPFAGSVTGHERLSRAIAAQLTARGDKFNIQNMQVGSLRGIQARIELPAPGIEAYILGETVLYHFFAGQDDESYRDIINSLREPNAEIL